MRINNFLIGFLIFDVILVILYIIMLQWQKKEKFSNNSTISPESVSVLLGSQMSNRTNTPIQFDKDPSAPPIDGDENSPSQMFSLAFNKSSLECCKDRNSGGLTTSKGCVCLTDKQRDWFSHRGNNNTGECDNSI